MFPFSFSMIALVLANCIPLWGVFVWGWNAEEILIVYWIENVAIGAVNVLKLLTNRHPETKLARQWFLVPFFLVHFGMFTFVHGVFISSFRDNPDGLTTGPPFAFLASAFTLHLWSFLGFLVSHLFSYFSNYLGKSENKHLTLSKVMCLPYQRIFVLHVTIILGAHHCPRACENRCRPFSTSQRKAAFAKCSYFSGCALRRSSAK